MSPDAVETQPQPTVECPWARMLVQLQDTDQEPALATHADIAGLLLRLARRRRFILKVTAAGMALAIVTVLLLPNMYTATATILPPQSSQSSLMGMLGQMGSLAGLGARELGVKNPADTYVAMLRSRSVADALVGRFDLRQVYGEKKIMDARKKLAGRSEIASTKEGTITIAVSDRDRKRSAALANGYVDELQNLTHRLAFTEAGERRIFFQKQLEDEKQALSAAELAMKATQERTGLVLLDAQGKAIVEAVAQVRAQIALKEVALRGLSSSATDRNPEVIRQKEQLAGLRQQLAKLEHSSSLGDGNIQVPTGKVPEVEVEYLRALREVKYHEALYEFLGKQLEAARIDEAKDMALVQVVDAAVEPERKSGPMRTVPVALLTALAFLGACCWVLLRDRFRDSDGHRKIQELRAEFSWLK